MVGRRGSCRLPPEAAAGAGAAAGEPLGEVIPGHGHPGPDGPTRPDSKIPGRAEPEHAIGPGSGLKIKLDGQIRSGLGL